MLNYDRMLDSTVRDLREVRRQITREINNLEQAAVIYTMPAMKVTYKLPKWRAEEEQTDRMTVYGQLLGLSRVNLQLREVKTGRVYWIKLRNILEIDDRPRLAVEDMTIREIRDATGV